MKKLEKLRHCTAMKIPHEGPPGTPGLEAPGFYRKCTTASVHGEMAFSLLQASRGVSTMWPDEPLWRNQQQIGILSAAACAHGNCVTSILHILDSQQLAVKLLHFWVSNIWQLLASGTPCPPPAGATSNFSPKSVTLEGGCRTWTPTSCGELM